MSSFKIPFGLIDGRIVEVKDVPSGLRCGCLCPGCKKALIARKGDVNAHHFAHAHAKDSDLCDYGSETAIHLMAKQILCEEMRIAAPECVVEKQGIDDRGQTHSASRTAHEEGPLVFDEIKSEQSIGMFIPDIVASMCGEHFIIEIAVTHFCEKDKISALRAKGRNVLEVDLRSLTKKLPSKDELRSYLIDEKTNREWLSLKSYGDTKERVERELKEKIATANSRHQARTVTAVERRQPSPQSSGNDSRSRPITYSKTDVKNRWFACPTCRDSQRTFPDWQNRLPEEMFLFSCTWEEAPEQATQVSCPFCNGLVSIP